MLKTTDYKNEIEIEKSSKGIKKWFDKLCNTLCTGLFWKKHLPIIDWLPNYSYSWFLSDLIAGLTVGLTVIPQGMAFAVIAGLPPQYGLYSAFLPCFIYIFLGTSKDITIGPTAISAMLIKPHVDKYGPEGVILITFLSGCLIAILSILKLGFIIDFISMSVISGFISAGAISIASSQIAPLLGFKSSGSYFLAYWKNVGQRITETTLWDPVLGFICIILLVLLKEIVRFPLKRSESLSTRICKGFTKYLSLGRNAIVVSIATVTIYLIMHFTGEIPVKITGPVVEGLPNFTIPKFLLEIENKTLSIGETASELSSAVIIPFLLVLESIVIAKAFAKGKSLGVTQEMLALGLSNLLGAFFQSFPVAGSFTRTAVNNASGVKTPMGGLYTGAMVLLCLAVLTRYLQYIPNATLAAVIICVVMYMIEIHHTTKLLWRSKKIDLLPLYSSFIGCLFIGMDIGIVIGILMNILIVLYDAARPKLKVDKVKVPAKNVLLIYPDRSLTYLSAEYVTDTIIKECNKIQEHNKEQYIIVDGRSINNIDSTSINALKSLLNNLKTSKIKLYFWNWNKTIVDTFIAFDPNSIQAFKYSQSLEQLIPDDDEEVDEDDPFIKSTKERYII